MNISHHSVQVNGISLHVVEAGPENGNPLILLHGFPDFWYTWKNQIDFLAEKGFRVIAPDQRGYNLSDKPEALPAYNIDQLASDVAALMDAFKLPRATLVGHDWGGSVAWRTAHLFPDRVEKLVVLNVPHSTVLKHALRNSWRQRFRSWYVLFFQIPRLPEACLRAFNQALLARTRQRGCRLSPEDLALYREAWARPGALRSMIQWYRALLQTKPQRLPSPEIIPPVMILWGPRDRYLNRNLASLSLDLCRQGMLFFIKNAAHWVHHDAAEEVNRLIMEFVGEPKAPAPVEPAPPEPPTAAAEEPTPPARRPRRQTARKPSTRKRAKKSETGNGQPQEPGRPEIGNGQEPS